MARLTLWLGTQVARTTKQDPRRRYRYRSRSGHHLVFLVKEGCFLRQEGG